MKKYYLHGDTLKYNLIKPSYRWTFKPMWKGKDLSDFRAKNFQWKRWFIWLTTPGNTLETSYKFVRRTQTQRTLSLAKKSGGINYFIKTFIIRGIGYRATILENDLSTINLKKEFVEEKFRPLFGQSAEDVDSAIHDVIGIASDFPYSRYLSIRAGHSKEFFQPLPPVIFAYTKKKDRKLVIGAASKNYTSRVAGHVLSYRPPSVYTGRGIRIKHSRPIRKAGKRDKQKGKSF